MPVIIQCDKINHRDPIAQVTVLLTPKNWKELLLFITKPQQDAKHLVMHNENNFL